MKKPLSLLLPAIALMFVLDVVTHARASDVATKSDLKAKEMLCPNVKAKKGQVTETVIPARKTPIHHEPISLKLQHDLVTNTMSMVSEAGELNWYRPQPVSQADVRGFVEVVAADLKICLR